MECPVWNLFVLQCQREATGEICLKYLQSYILAIGYLLVISACAYNYTQYKHSCFGFMHVCRRNSRRSRYVRSTRPMVRYFTDSSSVSGVATDVSMNDASDEESSDEGAYYSLKSE